MQVAPGITGRRVCVTGIGVVASCGIGVEAFWRGLFEPAAEGERRVQDFDASAFISEKDLRRTDRFVALGVVAAEEAIADAGGAEAFRDDPDRVGTLIGTGVGGIGTLEEQIVIRHERGPRRVTPFLVPMMMSNAAAASVSMRHGFRGPCEAIVTACAAGTQSIGAAARIVAMGRCDVMVAGGTEAGMTPTGMAGFTNMTAMSASGISAPFDARRDGFMISEGAGVLILEAEEHARARGARIYCYLDGAASTADAHHITAPAPGGSGAFMCMQFALDDAQLSPGDVKHINAHGTSTQLNDAAEAEAMAKLFGSSGPAVTSTKGVHGHALGGAGGIEAVAATLTIANKLIPPTIGTEAVDPTLPAIDLVLGKGREWEPGPTLSNSFGFGGHNGTIVLVP
jgi:3-oxoacyl-[acyl-carrier-protein] synthase II